jgi:hypothetical protein
LKKLPFDKVVVHISLPSADDNIKEEVAQYFNQYPVAEILYSPNSGKGEVDALKQFAATQDIADYDVLTYMHCKGVTKPENPHIWQWTRLMHYFIIEHMATCHRVFRKGYVTFGINKSIPAKGDEGFRRSRFYYEGNFVSLNLRKVDLKQAVAQHLEDSYYGVEGFWGKLCSYREGYTIFNSGVNHYLLSVPLTAYTTKFGRLKYDLTRQYYLFKTRLLKKKR